MGGRLDRNGPGFVQLGERFHRNHTGIRFRQKPRRPSAEFVAAPTPTSAAARVMLSRPEACLAASPTAALPVANPPVNAPPPGPPPSICRSRSPSLSPSEHTEENIARLECLAPELRLERIEGVAQTLVDLVPLRVLPRGRVRDPALLTKASHRRVVTAQLPQSDRRRER